MVTTQASFTVPPTGYRLPGDLTLGAVQLQIADLDRSVAYYERVVGLRTLERIAGEATLGPQGDPRPLVRLRDRPTRGRPPS